MEVAIGGNGTTPFQREVREWQHVDPNTGALLTGRLEADRWVNGPLNAYGKVVDSKNVSQPNGTQHTQRKQFEVLQARTSSGSLQVVRAQTVHKSSSRWSSDIRSVATGNYNTQNFGENTSLTNGYHSPLENGHEEDPQPERFANSKIVSKSSHSSSPIIPTSSVKLSALIKNDERKKPHSISNSLTLVQQQEYLKEQKQKFYTAPSDHTGSERKHVVDIFNGTSQNMSDSGISINFHVRGKSVSTDDLSIEWDQNEEDPESPSAWRRVSKIRRSFQFPKSSSPKPSSNRPSDLPENSVSVSRIRQELENGRRLHSDIRNNHEDRTSFDNILHGTVSQEDAESLKEIRGKLRKLSDESLYKDDFITDNTHNMSGNDYETTNHIIIQKETDVVSRTQEYSVQQPVVLQDSQIVSQKPSFLRRDKPPENSIYSTNSLEGRSKYRDMTSAEWHLRRKSYGFEKMVPSTDSMFRMETSTDSGIGRSSELANWSPTETQSGATVIMFGDKATPKSTLTFLSGKDASNASSVLSSFSSARQFFDSKLDVQEVKRHSIAVDESKYVRDNLKEVFDTKTSVHLNGLYNKDLNLSQASVSDENSKRTKRVEFCKTEVHFAAESGRVNIVETDGKPPPTNNFRRRRRTPSSSVTSAYLEAIHSGIPVTHFGDEQKPSFENDQKGTQEGSLSPMKANNVTVSTPFTSSETVTALKNAVLEEEDESAFSEEISLRGILKNKPVKPRPYHLGENIENSESLWGVRLKPIPSSNTAPIRLNNIENKDSAAIKDVKNDVKTILERVQTVEQRKNGSSFSTKVNLNMSDPLSSWEPPDVDEQHKLNKPIKLHLEEPITRNNSNETTPILTTPSSSSSLFAHRIAPEIEMKNNQSLKSTSLIMKTIRSANQFDEAMKRLSINEGLVASDYISVGTSTMTTASKLISNMNAITKSSSANSIFQEPVRSVRPKYTSSLDGDYMLNDRNEKNSPNTDFLSSARYMQALDEEPLIHTHENKNKKPIAAPRIRVIGSSNAVNHQLSQLRRMYEADSDDSAKADEEVNLYLGDGLAHKHLVEEKDTELSGSWSRVKAKRTNQRVKVSKCDVKELQDSNVMSIEFNSPPSSLTRNPESSGRIMANRSHPKPRSRNLSPAKGIISHPTAHEQEKLSSVKQKAVSQRVGHKNEIISEANKLPLKVGEGGARKLREHELSYFGVKVKTNGETKVITYRPEEDKRNISENYRKQLTNKNESVSVQKHKLPSDKPDLLKHSPKTHHVQSTNYNSSKTNCVPEVECKANNREDNDPIYENIDEIAPYNRKGDLERDEMILSEMTREAHLSLKPLKERKSGKGESPRSSSMKSHKPLDTIQETKHTKHSSHSQQMREHSKNHERSIKSKIVQVPQVSHDVVQRPCRANRTSSISSNDSLTRSPRASLSRQRSASKEKEVAEVHNAKRQSSVIRECAKLRHRSSSRDSKANASSSEEQSSKHAAESLRKIRRVKSKDSSKPVEKCEHKLHQSRQAIVTSTTRASTLSDDTRKVKCSPSSRHRNELDKSSSRRQDKSSGKERSSSTSRSRSSSTATEHQKSRTKTAGIVPTTSRSSKHDSNRIQRKK